MPAWNVGDQQGGLAVLEGFRARLGIARCRGGRPPLGSRRDRSARRRLGAGVGGGRVAVAGRQTCVTGHWLRCGRGTSAAHRPGSVRRARMWRVGLAERENLKDDWIVLLL